MVRFEDLAARELTEEEMKAVNGGLGFLAGVAVGAVAACAGVAIGAYLDRGKVKAEAPDLTGIPTTPEQL